MIYKDVIERNLVLPKKAKYTKADRDKLIKEGFKISEARFICVCSAVYHDTEYSKFFDKEKSFH